MVSSDDPAVGATLTVVVPAYNEASTLPALLPPLLDRAASRGWRVVVVDDGSTDDTAAVLARAGAHPTLAVVRHKVRRGSAARSRAASVGPTAATS